MQLIALATTLAGFLTPRRRHHRDEAVRRGGHLGTHAHEPLALALRKRPGRHKASQGPDHMTEKRAFLNFVPCFGSGTIHYRRYINFHRLASRSKRCARATSWPRRRARLGDCHGHGLPRPWTNRRISSAVSRLDIILPISSDGIASFRRTPNGTLGARLRTTAVTRAWKSTALR